MSSSKSDLYNEDIVIQAIRPLETGLDKNTVTAQAWKLYNNGMICRENMLILATLSKRWQSYCLVQACYFTTDQFQSYFPHRIKYCERGRITKFHPAVLLYLKMGKINIIHASALRLFIPVKDQLHWLEEALGYEGIKGAITYAKRIQTNYVNLQRVNEILNA